MAVSVKASKETLDELKRRMAEARKGLQNNGVAMLQVAVYLDQWVQRNFKGQGANVGKWAPYKYGGRTVSKSKANGQSIEGRKWINGSAVMLQDTGALRISFLPFVKKGLAGIGSDLPYSKVHEEGDPSRNLPQRRMLPKEDEVHDRVVQILDNFIAVRLGGLR